MRGNGKTVQAPETTMQVPEMSMQAPETTMQAPETTMQVPEMSMQAPETTMQVPETTMQVPEMSMQAPETTMQVPEMSMQPSARSRQSLIAYRADTTIEQRLLAAQVAIDWVLADVGLQDIFAPYGYDSARMLQGKALHDTAQALAQRQGARAGDQRRARKTRDATQAQARAFFMGQLALARAALRDDPGAAQVLDLGARKHTSAGWLMQAQQFYANALNDAAILAKLAVFGITREQLELGQSQVDAVAAGIVVHQQHKGVKQETTRARDAALAALDRWMRDFNTAARVALAK